MDPTLFNQMRKPRPVNVNRKGYLLAIFLFIAMVVPTAVIAYFDFKNESFNLALKRDGMKADGKIIETHLERSGKHTVRVATYEYQYLGQTYRSHGIENHGHASEGATINVYFSPTDPNVSRAEFAINDEHSMHVVWVFMSVFLLSMLVVNQFITYTIIFKPQKIMANGHMEQAVIMNLYRGRNQGADAAYTFNGQNLTSRVPFQIKKEIVGSTINVVFDPSKPKKAIKYPNPFCDVISQHGPIVG
jgi:Protein of unknown function (DUF3592)